MKPWASLFLVFTFSVQVFAQSSLQAPVYIVEYDGKIDAHAKNIEDILCLPELTCHTRLLRKFSGPDFATLNSKISETKKSVVNFSFVLQFADPLSFGPTMTLSQIEALKKEFQEGFESLTEEVGNIHNLITANPETFFAVAAGNGFRIAGIQSAGIALGGRSKLYPASFSEANMVIVAAVSEDKAKIAHYSNYGLTAVDVAAPVLKNRKGETLQGTSYATPFVAKVASQLQNKYSLSVQEIKEVLLKSCHIQDVQMALAATEDLLKNQKNSVTYKAMYEKKRKLREGFQVELGPVMLVKCGGVLQDDLAMSCADHYSKSQKQISISEACLRSRPHLSSNEASDLRTLWDLRGI